MKKNILIIGGSHGIGREVVRMMHKDYQIFTACRTEGELNSLPVQYQEYDVLNDSPDALQLPEEIHGFVYCPGSINLRPFKMLSEKDFREDMEVNFFALTCILPKVLAKMQEGSSMVFYSTVAVQTGMPFHTSVAAAKGAIEGFARALAAEYTPKIRVNVIAPSLTDTPLAERLLNNDGKKQKMSERHPLKSVGTAEDMAKMTTFLLTDDSRWITGQVFKVDGGISALNIN
ncbi:SDR family NAD(P)-dependent oxidoreductase [Robertkochia sediminum]|uniref:SDR family NAD(P)-dependent oxidoreductase n=1 Tax=Robertkochia sediminum TaxID=2785326 RepID=UPI001933216D|nr:SDR family oxidoreductase [Robertkochia sediminum]MBL7473194.1 SDR family oxidoreductase [Robertkochia sediminum]